MGVCVGGELTSGGRVGLPSASEGREAVGRFGGEAVVWARGAGVLEPALVWGKSAFCFGSFNGRRTALCQVVQKTDASQAGRGSRGAARRTAKLAVARLVESAHLRHDCGGPSSGAGLGQRAFVEFVVRALGNGDVQAVLGKPGWWVC